MGSQAVFHLGTAFQLYCRDQAVPTLESLKATLLDAIAKSANPSSKAVCTCDGCLNFDDQSGDFAVRVIGKRYVHVIT